MHYDVVIVGGGITGLTAAYRLTKDAPHLKVALIEASGRLGGKLHTDRVGGFLLEGGADSFLSRKAGGLRLCRELGIDGELIGRLELPHQKSNRAWVKRHGKFHPLPEGLTGLIPTNLDALKTTTLLSDEGKARIAEEPNQPAGDFSADQSVGDFITSRLGREAYENIVEPLMSGIYAADGDQLSILSTFPQLRSVVQKHGSLIGGLSGAMPPPNPDALPPFVSFVDGIGYLITKLIEQIDAVEIHINTSVKSIGRLASGKWQVASEQLELTSDRLIVTTPAHVNAKLLEDVDMNLAQAMGDIPFAGTVLVNVGLNANDLDLPEGYGYVIPKVEQRNVLACTWTSEKWPERAPDGKKSVRVYIGRHGEDDVCAMDDHTLIEMARQELIQTLGLPDNAKQMFVVHRWPKGLAQYNLGHQEVLGTIDNAVANLPGFAIAGASYRGVGIPDCIDSAEAAVKKIFNLPKNQSGF